MPGTTISARFAPALLAGLLIAQSAAAQVDSHRDIVYPDLGEFVIPEPEIFELDNGLEVFLLEDHELPLIDLMARVRTGAVYEPAEKAGLAGIAGAVQRTGGTRTMSGDEIDDFLEARAASVETSISATVGFASMSCLKDDFDDVLAVFHDVLRHPEFAQDKIDIAVNQAKSGVARRNDDVNSITSREFSRLIYGPESPLSRLQEYATLAAISRDDLKAFHAESYHPNNVLLGVVGDFDSAEMKRRLTEVFGGWPRGPEFDEAPPAYRAENEPGVFFIEKEDVTQASVQLGHLGIRYDNPDYFAVQVMNEVLGGGFSSRMFSRVRSEKGLAYSVFGSLGAGFLVPGLMRAGLQTKSETMGEAVDAVLAEIRGMIDEPATEAELARAKDSILNSFIFNYASARQVLGQQMLYAYYGLPLDFLEQYRAKIEQVAAEDVARVAEAYLHPDEVTLLVVGRSADFDRPVSSFGEVTELDISIPPPPDAAAAVARTDEAVAAGGAVLARLIERMGGAAVAAVESTRAEIKVTVQMQGTAMELGQEIATVFPDRLRLELSTPMGTQVVIRQGDRAIASAGGQQQELPSPQVDDLKRDLARDLVFLARSGAGAVEAVAAGAETIEGVEYDRVAVSLDGSTSQLWVDGEGSVLKQSYQGPHPFTQAPVGFEVTYADFREVAGVRVPYRRSMMIDGEPFAEVELLSYEINPELEESLFELAGEPEAMATGEGG